MIEKHYYRIDVIERVLASKEMEEDEREQLETELRNMSRTSMAMARLRKGC